MEVYLRGVGSEFGIPRGDRPHDEKVLGSGGGQSRGVIDSEATNAHEMSAQGRQRGGQVRIPDGGIDGIVESGDEPVVGVASRIDVLEQLVDSRELSLKLLEHRGITASGGEASRLLLEGLAHLEDLPDARERQISDDEAATGLGCHQAIRHQSRERLPQGGARDTEAGGLLDLSQHTPRTQLPLHDLVAQGLVGPVACPLTDCHCSPFFAFLYTLWPMRGRFTHPVSYFIHILYTQPVL